MAEKEAYMTTTIDEQPETMTMAEQIMAEDREILSALAQATTSVETVLDGKTLDGPATAVPGPVLLPHHLAFSLYDSARTTKSPLDPLGRNMYKTMTDTKKPPLDPVFLNWERVSQMAYLEVQKAVTDGRPMSTATVGVRVSESMFTKKNKFRLVADDPKSPLGTILKFNYEIDMLHKPYAFAEFNAYDVFRYAVHKLPDRPSWLPASAGELDKDE
jgi:hypothetical protein